MTTICIIPDGHALVRHQSRSLTPQHAHPLAAGDIAHRIPCIANYRHGEITVKCRVEDAAWVENMLADLV